MVTSNQTGIGEPIVGGVYQLQTYRIKIIAMGTYCGQLAVVSRINNSHRLSIWPMEHWKAEYGSGHLLSVDKSVSQYIFRGSGSWLNLGCLVSEFNGELFLSEYGAIDSDD